MANSYLSSNTGTATNAKKFTYSVWLKRSKISSEQRFYQGYKDGNNRAYAVFLSSDKLRVYNMTASNIELYWDSTRVFRDTSAWYHIVLSADSTQAAQADRFKVYVNGVEETDFTKNYNPGQNIDWGNQLAQTNGDLTISGTESQTQLFEGYMSHAAFVDGTALTPTSFGETDSTSGIWKFKSPTGITWGNNGYHLKFENSANLGLDSSGNTNNFTVGGDLKQAVDTPSNVYCAGNPLARYGGNVNYTNGDNFITGGGNAWTMGSATMGVSSGKWYYELKMLSAGTGNGYFKMGFQSADQSYAGTGHTAESGLDASYAFYNQNGNLEVRTDGAVISGYDTSTLGVSFSMNDIMCLAIDMDNKKAYFRKNGDAWIKSADPVNGTNGLDFSSEYPAGKGIVPNFAIYYPGTAALNFGNGLFGTTAIASAGSNGNGSLFEYDVPSGYYALNTKNINTYG